MLRSCIGILVNTWGFSAAGVVVPESYQVSGDAESKVIQIQKGGVKESRFGFGHNQRRMQCGLEKVHATTN